MLTVPSWEEEYDADVARNSGQFASRDKEDYMLEEIAALRALLACPAALQPLPHTIGPKVRVLPLRTTYTPTQALQMALRFTENLEEVIVVGQFERDEDGRKELYVSPSKMDISMAVWIHRRLGFYIDENA